MTVFACAHIDNLYHFSTRSLHNNILIWDNPNTGLALVAADINGKAAPVLKKSIYSAKQRRLCDFLKEARLACDLSQREMAEKLNRPQSFVAKYEAGERRLDVIELFEIAIFLKIKPADIWDVIAN